MNLNECLVFIDELCPNDPALTLKIQFLRNLCRYINIPVILSSTNSHANNLIGRQDSVSSGTNVSGKLRWVKVITQLPKSNLITMSIPIRFNDFKKKKRSLREFISEDLKTFDYESIAKAIFKEDDKKIETSVQFLKFIVPLLLKTLPGIAKYSLDFLFIELTEISLTDFSLKYLWATLVNIIAKVMAKRKMNLLKIDGLISTIHTMTFPCDLKRFNESGGSCAKKVNSHFFHYGLASDSIIDLYLHAPLNPLLLNEKLPRSTRTRSNIQIIPDLNRENGTIFEDSCYFPDFCEDILLNLGSLTCWSMVNKSLHPKYTLANIYEHFLGQGKNFKITANSTVQDSFALELLSHWCICSASHLNIEKCTGGNEFLLNFIKNVQSCNNIINSKSICELKFEFGYMPRSLSRFLEEITVPYLIQIFSVIEKMIEEYNQFMQLGKSYLCPFKDGWDVNFDVNFRGESRVGFVECKFLATPIGLPTFLEYYEKACSRKLPISLLVCRDLQSSISSDDSWKKFDSEEILKEQEKMKEQEKKKKFNPSKKTKTSPNHQLETIMKLWASDDENHVNIYTINFKDEVFKAAKKIGGSFSFNAIKEFSNPKGVFILVDSNFDPPIRTALS